MTEALAPAPLRLAAVPLVVVTRFSYLGRSGWKSDASRDAALLFEPERLRLRLELFRSITLPSLAAQTDRSFSHVILTSNQMPAWAMNELKEACATAHGPGGRYAILARRPGISSAFLRRHLQTISAADALAEEPADAIAVRVWAEVCCALDLGVLPLPPHRIVKEKRATFAQTPDDVARRPASATRWKNLWLAGDWIDTGLPATIEGAVRSGQSAAHLIMAAD